MAWYRTSARALTRRPREIVPSEWLTVEIDEEAGVYVTAMEALNLPIGPLGDWHETIWRPPKGKRHSTRRPATEALCRLGTELWGCKERVDAREALRIIGHPSGGASHPIWAASHPRAVAEMVISAVQDEAEIIDPDPQSTRRWLDAAGRRTCTALLNEAKDSLKKTGQRDSLDEWIRAVSDQRGLCRATA